MSIHRTQRNWGCRIHEYRWFGIDAVTLENDRVRVPSCQARGRTWWSSTSNRGTLDFAWLAPGGIRNPHDLVAPHRDGVGPFIESIRRLAGSLSKRGCSAMGGGATSWAAWRSLWPPVGRDDPGGSGRQRIGQVSPARGEDAVHHRENGFAGIRRSKRFP